MQIPKHDGADLLRLTSSCHLHAQPVIHARDHLPQSGLVRDYLRAKYAGRNLDVVIAVTDTALAFIRQHPDLFPGVPIVALVTRGSLKAGDSQVTGLQQDLAVGDTLGFALKLQPATERLYVVDGALHNTGDVEAEFRKQVAALERPLELVYLRDLPLADLISRIEVIPERSILFFVRQLIWDHATPLSDLEGLRRVVKASPVPMFTFNDSRIGNGSVGGCLWKIARSIVDAHAGRMAAENNADGGATVWFSVPVSQGSGESPDDP